MAPFSLSQKMAAPARYELEVKITSATDLKNVNWRHGQQLKPYAVVWVEPQTKCATICADVSGGGTYRWDQKLLISFSTPILGSTLHIHVIHAEGTRPLIGSAQIALCGRRADRTLQLKRPSGRPQGKLELEFSVRALVETRRGSGSGVDAVAGDFSGILLTDDDDDDDEEFFGEEDDDDDFGNDY